MTYSKDYKINTLRLYNNRKNFSLSIKNILEHQNIARSTLYDWINNKEVKQRKKKKYSKITEKCKVFIISYVEKYKQFQIKKLIKVIGKKFQISISKRSIYNVLKQYNITNKRVKQNHYPYNENKLKDNIKKVTSELKECNHSPISIDETGIYFNTKSNYGWSKKGKDCEINGKKQLKKVSLVVAISRNKVIGFTIRNGSFNARHFNNFMLKVKKNNKENKKYFLDNARIHHAKLLNTEIKNNMIYNVPYYSKFNPIEMFFNTLKIYLNKMNITTICKLRRHLNIFINKVNSIELNNYFEKAFSFFKN